MGKINWNPLYIFSKTNENYVFGKGGIIWKNTIGKISALSKAIFSKPSPQHKPIVATSQTAPSPLGGKLVNFMNANPEFMFSSDKTFMEVMKEHNEDETDTDKLSKDKVEDSFKEDIDPTRNTIVIASGLEDPKALKGNTREEKLESAIEFLKNEMPQNSGEERLAVLNCLQQTLLQELTAQISKQLSVSEQLKDHKVYLAPAYRSKGGPSDDNYICLQFFKDTILITGKKYFDVWTSTSTRKGKETLAFVRASIHVEIPKSNFAGTKCQIVLEKASTKLEDLLPATEKTKKIGEKLL